jgi:hypothetical protein
MRKRKAIEAVARHFAAEWEGGGSRSDGYLTIEGKRIAIEVSILKQGIVGRDKPRLRFDRVVLSLKRRLQSNLRDTVPDGKAVIVTVTAPIRVPSKTAVVLEENVRSCLLRQTARVDVAASINGNRTRIRVVRGVPSGASKVIVFVHNPETDADVLLDVTQSMLECLGEAAGKIAPRKSTGDRWLVIANDGGLSHIDTYRQVYSQLSISTDFKRILMVLGGARVEALSG